ncbi:hypothetical protein DPMN_122112 [Dreissena polymorpha]|uniref:Uncharacterized protein n=1 Tax=Dreissena polymorpha TaxID=45954 RepID=A0A9D4GMY7_DREPO|nr:hypothetical protein DPMN_122112 [Dreissena polymorpha]
MPASSNRENLTQYCAKLENIFAQAVEMKAVSRQNDKLRRVLHQGLSSRLKHLSSFKFDNIKDYDKLRKEVRAIESDLENELTNNSVTCNAYVKTDKQKDKIEKQLDKMSSVLD